MSDPWLWHFAANLKPNRPAFFPFHFRDDAAFAGKCQNWLGPEGFDARIRQPMSDIDPGIATHWSSPKWSEIAFLVIGVHPAEPRRENPPQVSCANSENDARTI